MISNPTAALPASMQMPARAIATRLEQSLGHVFDIVLSSQLSLYLELNGDCDRVPLANDWDALDTSRVIQLDGRRHVLIVPVPCHHGTNGRRQHLLPAICLVATSYEPFPALGCKLADAIVEAEQWRDSNQLAQHKLDHSLYQLTTSFEELTWLRSLAEHFEICSLADGLARAGQATLPALRQLIYAQELILLGIVNDQGSDGTVPPILAYDGDGLLSQEAIGSLFLRLTLHAHDALTTDSLIVWNAPIYADQATNESEIRNCILVPVVKSQELHGWLLAINKSMPDDEMLHAESAVQDQNLIEFGTSEAGLMSTMAVMLATHTKNVNLLCEKEELLMGVLRALVSTIDAKDAYTGGHSDRVATYSRTIASQLGLSEAECEQIYMSGLLHDIGKIGVPDAVLGKPERLTEEEFEQIKRHPVIGYEILKSLKPFAYLLDGVLHHHESFDGSGYPHGLTGTHIPLMGRIIAVADSYDAMTSNRTYRQGMPVAKALQILTSGQGKQWDPQIVEALLESLQS